MGVRAAYRDVFAIRDARSLICASAASQLGDWLYNAALLGYVYAATGSAAWVGAATTFRLLPFVLFGPLGGAIADRYDRRRVLLAGDLLRLALMLCLAAVVAVDGHIVLVIALTALASTAGAAERPAALSLLPRLVGESRLGPANALLHTVQDLGVVLGPALGAVLLAVAPNEVAFLANAVTFAVSAVFIASMRPAPVRGSVEAGSGLVAHLVDGTRTARATPFIVPLFLVVAMIEFTYGAQTVQLVLVAERSLDLGVSGYGWLLAAAGVGGLLSSLVNPRFTASNRISVIVAGTGILFCATQLVYAGVEGLAIALLVTVVGGIGFVACEVVAETALARVAPAQALGRVMGVFDSLSVGAMIGGAVLAAFMVERTSLRTSLLVLGALTLVVIGGCYLALRGLDALSATRSEAISARLAVIEPLPIVAGSPRMVLEMLASSAQICPLPAGVDVVVEGAPAHAFFAVIDGGVVVHRDGQAIAHLGPGDYFGERGLLDNAPRNATVTTESASTVLRIEGEALLEALQTSPTIRAAIDHAGRSGVAGSATGETPLVDDATWRPS